MCSLRTCRATCNTTQTDTWKCKTTAAVASIPLNSWYGKRICFKRGSVAASKRPAVGDDGTCSGDYQVCTSKDFSGDLAGITNTTSSVCALSSGPCPITGASFSTNGTLSITRSGSAGSIGLPIVDLSLVRGIACKFPTNTSKIRHIH